MVRDKKILTQEAALEGLWEYLGSRNGAVGETKRFASNKPFAVGDRHRSTAAASVKTAPLKTRLLGSNVPFSGPSLERWLHLEMV